MLFVAGLIMPLPVNNSVVYPRLSPRGESAYIFSSQKIKESKNDIPAHYPHQFPSMSERQEKYSFLSHDEGRVPNSLSSREE